MLYRNEKKELSYSKEAVIEDKIPYIVFYKESLKDIFSCEFLILPSEVRHNLNEFMRKILQ